MVASTQINIRIKPTDLSSIKTAAQEAGLTMSQYMIMRATKQSNYITKRQIAISNEARQRLHAINKIGHNINQIAKSLNIGQPLDTAVLVALKECRDALERYTDVN